MKKMNKKIGTKLLISLVFVISMFLIVSISAFAADLAVGNIEQTETETTVSFAVYYTATDVEQVTVLAVYGGQTAPTTFEVGSIVYIDQQASTTDKFVFTVDKSKFDATNSYIHIKLGGTAIDAPKSADAIQIYSAVSSFRVFGYVGVTGATVSLDANTTTTTDDNGMFEFLNVLNGPYNLEFTAKSALKRTIPVTVADADNEVSLATNKITLMFGDTDGNGKIEIDDLLNVKGTFNKVSTAPEYNTNYDLDSNGKIEIDDLLVIKGNFNKSPTNYLPWVK